MNTLHTSPTQPSGAPEWWRNAVIYQIYPRSFASSSGPIGDLRGITSRLDYLADLGVDAVWLSPFYVSPQNDGGYDVADYRDIDPLFGTLEDADALITRSHELGLRVIIDLVPNHTSDQHPWFREALAAGPSSPARQRYMFRESEEIPNNWHSIFGGPGWTRVCERADAPGSAWEHDRSWYLNLFDSSQPDLNWEHPEVRAEFVSILRFWLARGVDGFRVDVAHGLVKDPALPNWGGHVEMAGADNQRAPMFDQDGVHEIYRAWRKVLEEFDGARALVAEAWVDPPERLARYIRPDEMHQAFNFDYLVAPWQPDHLKRVIEAAYAANSAVGAPTTWVLSNHDVVRHSSRFGMAYTGKSVNGIGAEDPQPDAELGLRRARAATLLMLGLAGSSYLYQGEELGLPEHTSLPDSLREDPAFFRTAGAEKGRDGCRVPLPWEADSPAFGFSPDGASWLPQPRRWARLAVDQQRGTAGSTLELYRAALRLRRQWALGDGTLQWIEGSGMRFISRAAGRPDVLVLTTFEEAAEIPEGWRVELASGPVGHYLPPDTTAWLTSS